ncbi:sulfatase [Cellulophaga sp. 20_2_10]|uniref:sulfatase n=1 Tax=Cellulophaga sp. 20_2_10 TaxID=2942476 RepID=UPI00201A5763|nr:sulfatase [Cellulophaga sp. 20_2_10]MCL5245342.1 sulfatase [Cellulophaga sp. 20_2_10]
MRNRIYISLVFILLICSVVTAQNNKKQPNVLFIMVDDLNDWVGAFGGNQQAITPNIDALAAKGVVFKNAYCSAPLCNPSRTSILTGYQPSTTGVYGNNEVFREIEGFKNTVTLPQYFEENGYETAAAGKIFHNARGRGKEPKEGSDPGSFQQEKIGNAGTVYPSDENRHSHNLNLKKYGVKGSFLRSFDWYATDSKDEENNDFKSAQYCADFINQEHTKPFFVACGIFKPHLPWYAPTKYFDLYNLDAIKLPTVLENDLSDVGRMGNNMAKKGVHKAILDSNNWKQAVRAYLANISFADACVGHVLNALEQSDYADNTIIVLMGDHGWHLGEKEHWSKNALWERAAKTPLLVVDPRTKNVGISTKIVSLLDVYPTLVDICNLPEKKDLEGVSIAKLLQDSNANWDHTALTIKAKGIYSLRNNDYRYTVYSDGFEELYNHKIDPNEWTNIAKDKGSKTVLTQFRKELQQKLK